MNLAIAGTMALELMDHHGLRDWKFCWSQARKQFGSCWAPGKVIRLSAPLSLLNDEPKVRDVVLHEIAHALVPHDGHGFRWRAKCREIGARPERCYSVKDVVQPPMPYEATCHGCNRVYGRARVVPSGQRACAGCCKAKNGGRFTVEYELHYRRVR